MKYDDMLSDLKELYLITNFIINKKDKKKQRKKLKKLISKIESEDYEDIIDENQ